MCLYSLSLVWKLISHCLSEWIHFKDHYTLGAALAVWQECRLTKLMMLPKCEPLSDELNLPLLETTFSRLPSNHIVLLVRPLNKHFKQWADKQLADRCNRVDPSAEVPSWSLPALGVQQLRYNQKKQLIISAAKGGQLTTLGPTARVSMG